MNLIFHLAFILVFLTAPLIANQENIVSAPLEIETKYDAAKNETTVKLAPIKLSGEKGKYRSLHSLISFKYQGQQKRIPEFLAFELVTLVKARKLHTDLYVQLIVDGEKIFLSSNRWAEINSVPEKLWLSEHIVLRMPHEVFVKITRAKEFSIQMGKVKFNVSAAHVQLLRDFDAYINGT